MLAAVLKSSTTLSSLYFKQIRSDSLYCLVLVFSRGFLVPSVETAEALKPPVVPQTLNIVTLAKAWESNMVALYSFLPVAMGEDPP